MNSAELQWCMTQVSLGTSEKCSCGALRFRCFNKRFDILLKFLLQGWGVLNSAEVQRCMTQVSLGTSEKFSCGEIGEGQSAGASSLDFTYLQVRFKVCMYNMCRLGEVYLPRFWSVNVLSQERVNLPGLPALTSRTCKFAPRFVCRTM